MYDLSVLILEAWLHAYVCFNPFLVNKDFLVLVLADLQLRVCTQWDVLLF